VGDPNIEKEKRPSKATFRKEWRLLILKVQGGRLRGSRHLKNFGLKNLSQLSVSTSPNEASITEKRVGRGEDLVTRVLQYYFGGGGAYRRLM